MTREERANIFEGFHCGLVSPRGSVYFYLNREWRAIKERRRDKERKIMLFKTRTVFKIAFVDRSIFGGGNSRNQLPCRHWSVLRFSYHQRLQQWMFGDDANDHSHHTSSNTLTWKDFSWFIIIFLIYFSQNWSKSVIHISTLRYMFMLTFSILYVWHSLKYYTF